MPDSDSPVTPREVFATTRWTVVLHARDASDTQAREALENLCRAYWYPLYAFVRRQGVSPEDAQDLTQAFFERLIEKNFLADVQRDKGRFRSFLLAALKHFLANEWDKARALKRGGGVVHVPIDTASAETRYGLEPAHFDSPEKLFERRWAITLLDRVLERLRDEHVKAGKADMFEQLKPSLTAEKASLSYAELGARLGLSEGAVKVAVHRLRQRYRELLRAEIAETVDNPGEVDEELRHLFTALSA
jgi:RNA polymerase sigma factor (sigma-70 family)